MTAPVETGGPLAASTDAVVAVDRPLSASRQRRPIWQSPVVWGLVLAVAGGLIGGWLWWSKSRLSGLAIDCRRAVEDKDWPRLERAATTWSRLQPRESRSWIYLAQAQGSTGRLDLAAASLDRVDERDPKGLAALFERVDLTLSGLNDPLEAERTCRRILAVQPDAGRAHQRLIYIYSVSLQRPEMMAQLVEAIRRRCEPPEAYPLLVLGYSLYFSSGLASNRDWLQKCPSEEVLVAADAVYRSRTLRNGGTELPEDPDKEVGVPEPINNALLLFPRNVLLRSIRLQYQMAQRDLAGCTAELERNQLGDDQNPIILRARGWLAQQLEQWDLAAEYLRAALSIWPTDWRSRFELSIVERRRGDAEAAKAAASLSVIGKELERKLQRAATPNDYDLPTLIELEAYFRACGCDEIAAAAQRRIIEWQAGERSSAETGG